MTEIDIGIDISKDHLDAHRLPDGAATAFPNTPKGGRNLLAWIDRDPIEPIVYEATGTYHRESERSVTQAGLPLAKVNPRRACRFAEAIGVLPKTDKVDAAMLARMGRSLQPDQTHPPDQSLAELKDLHLARRTLLKDRTAARNRRIVTRLALIKRQVTQRLKQIERQIPAIDDAIRQKISNTSNLQRQCDILVSIPGISITTATTLIAEVPELGKLKNIRAASLARLAPITRQSGKWQGKANIRGGRAALRNALYMPAARFNPDLKSTYLRLCKAGKPKKSL